MEKIINRNKQLKWYIKNKKTLKTIQDYAGTILGAFIIAIGTSLFLLPNQLSTGGVSGVATITYYLFGFSMGKVIVIINIPLFIMAGLKIGKGFFKKSLLGTISLSFFIDLLNNMQPFTDDRLLASIYGGAFVGLGTAIIFKVESSTGGSDLISFMTKRKNPNVQIGSVITLIDGAIVLLNVIFLKEIEIGLYSAIAIFLMGKVIDIIFEGVNFTKLLIIISNKNEEIAKEIGIKAKRGSTGLIGKGMYKNKDKLVLLCAASRVDIARIKKIIKEIDENSFVIVANAREVLGLGFKN